MTHRSVALRRAGFVAGGGLAVLTVGILAMSVRVGAASPPPRPSSQPSSAPATQPGAKAGVNIPYVGAYSVDHEFQYVTEECMQIIRSKKVLFGSRSWGLDLGNIIGRRDKKYQVAWNPHQSPQINDKERVLVASAFDQPRIVHYVFAPVPRRWAFFDDFLRKDPWKFGEKVDGAFQFLYCVQPRECTQFAEEYFPMLDKLIADYPKVQFAIATHHVSGDGNDRTGVKHNPASDWNIGGEDYSQAVIQRYYGKVAILDLRDIFSTHADGTPCTFEHNGKTYHKMCPEYIIPGGDQIHPNSPLGKERLGKGFLLLMTKMFCADKLPPLNTPKPEILK